MTRYLFLKIDIIDGEHTYSERVLCQVQHDDWRKEDYAEVVASQILGWCYSDLMLPEQNDSGQWTFLPQRDEYRLVELEPDNIHEISHEEFQFLRKFLNVHSVQFPFAIRVDGDVCTLEEISVLKNGVDCVRTMYKNQETNEVYDSLAAYCHVLGINTNLDFPEMIIESWIDADFS
jgi:hypothetical protein